MPTRKAPWTDEEVKHLQAYQDCDLLHPFTGEAEDGHSAKLSPTPHGWALGGKIVQDWAHEFMLDGSAVRLATEQAADWRALGAWAGELEDLSQLPRAMAIQCTGAVMQQAQRLLNRYWAIRSAGLDARRQNELFLTNIVTLCDGTTLKLTLEPVPVPPQDQNGINLEA